MKGGVRWVGGRLELTASPWAGPSVAEAFLASGFVDGPAVSKGLAAGCEREREEVAFQDKTRL